MPPEEIQDMASLLSESDALKQVKVTRRKNENAKPPTVASGSNEDITVVSGKIANPKQ